MAEHLISRRGIARVAILVAVLAASIAGLPSMPRGDAVPETVLRAVGVDPAAMLRPGPGLSMGSDRILRAAERTRTARVGTCAPIWFDGLAFTWTQPAGGGVAVRVATGASGRFGSPTVLDAEGGADPGTPEYRTADRGSEYLWTGGARCTRFSLRLPAGARVGDVRVLFINSSGTADGPGTGRPDPGPVAVGQPRAPLGLSAAEALARRPRIITREQWGANPKLMNCTPSVASFLKMGFVHHTAGSNAYSRAQADDVVRGIYAYHTNGRGWCDVGYNFLVDRYGDVFEGRSGGMTENVIGAAQMGFNTGAFSVSMMGNFDISRPPGRAIRALERLFAWRLDVAHVNPKSRTVMVSGGGSTTRYPAGTSVRLRTISGHRDTGLTACPGRYLYPLIPSIRQVVGSMGLPKIYGPGSSTPSIVAGQPARVRVRAKSSGTYRWVVTVLAPGGETVATLRAPRSDMLRVRWITDGALAAGSYRIVVKTAGAVGSRARPARLPLTVEPAPSPSPSPSPTATASPTP